MSSAVRDEDDVSLEKLPVSNLGPRFGSKRPHARRGRGPVGDPHGEFGGKVPERPRSSSGVGEGYLSGSIPLRAAEAAANGAASARHHGLGVHAAPGHARGIPHARLPASRRHQPR